MRGREYVLEVALGGKAPAVGGGILHLLCCLNVHIAAFDRVLVLILVVRGVLDVHRVVFLVTNWRC